MSTRSVGRVAVAMSGGVDSSVCAALLVEQGFDVHGIMLRLWSESGQAETRDNRCCTRDQMIDAHLVAKQLGIPFEIIDIRDTFKSTIVDHFIDGFNRGVTPNPCLACNRQIRFTVLLNEALQSGSSHLATGHYARISQSESGVFELRKAVDATKDQSYVLSVLNQSQLSHALFPLGSYTKVEVRAMATRFGLKVASKKDSQDLCFIADGNYRRFLQEHASSVFIPGPITNSWGKIVGQHDGLANYTIGQRKGINVTSPEPLYVLDKMVAENTLIVGPKHELGTTEFRISGLSWTDGHLPMHNLEVDVKTRYKAVPTPASVSPLGVDSAIVRLHVPAPDITPGQGAVLYDADRVVGSGIIEASSRPIH